MMCVYCGIKQTEMMNYLKHTTTYTSLNGTEYKQVSVQQWNEEGHKKNNSFYINGKKVVKQEKFDCEQKLLDNPTEDKTERWVK